MTSRISKLVLAAVLAGSVPAAAAAHDGDHGRDGRPVVSPAFWQPGPAPREGWREEGPRGHRREVAWRERALASAHAELRALDAERAAFHARNAWRPGQLRRYDRRYFARRAVLEQRCHELERIAWR